jgi:hypothetical protein
MKTESTWGGERIANLYHEARGGHTKENSYQALFH